MQKGFLQPPVLLKKHWFREYSQEFELIVLLSAHPSTWQGSLLRFKAPFPFVSLCFRVSLHLTFGFDSSSDKSTESSNSISMVFICDGLLLSSALVPYLLSKDFCVFEGVLGASSGSSLASNSNLTCFMCSWSLLSVFSDSKSIDCSVTIFYVSPSVLAGYPGLAMMEDISESEPSFSFSIITADWFWSFICDKWVVSLLSC